MDIITVSNKHTEAYGKKADYLLFSPGRVNIIGEHTDYNGGWVFPCALSLGVYCAASKRDDKRFRFNSIGFPGVFEIDASKPLAYDKSLSFANYPTGVINELKNAGFELRGFDITFGSDLPVGAGLSSSAAVEMAAAVLLNEACGLGLPRLELVKLSQRAENEFIGVKCGIMDQFAVGMCKDGHAVLLNCEKLEYEHIPLNLGGRKLVISNTNKPRGLADSKYNERRGQCEAALSDLKIRLDIANLSGIDTDEFEAHKSLIKDDTNRKRAEHVVYENVRVLKTRQALERGDIAEAGRLMNQSHDSLRDLYEVTGKELDTLVSAARKQSGVLGSRMTGAGFGGCTVSIVETEAVPEFMRNTGEEYTKIIGYPPSFYIAGASGGTRMI